MDKYFEKARFSKTVMRDVGEKMKTISPFFMLIPITVVVACIGFVVYVIRARIRRDQEPGPLRQAFMLAIAAFLFANLGATLIAPCGPGSGMSLFLTLLFPCVLFVIIGPRLSRVLAILLACGCIAGAWSEHRARERFGEPLRARMEERRRESMEKLKEDTEIQRGQECRTGRRRYRRAGAGGGLET